MEEDWVAMASEAAAQAMHAIADTETEVLAQFRPVMEAQIDDARALLPDERVEARVQLAWINAELARRVE